jgi:hypothetical protein
MSNKAIFDEALNSEQLRMDRQDRARGFATGVDSIDNGLKQQTIGNYANLSSMYQQQAQDPYSLVLGRSTTPAMAQNSLTQAGSMATTPSMFDPFNDQIMSMYNAQYNANNASSISANNNDSSKKAALIGGGASIAAAAIVAL